MIQAESVPAPAGDADDTAVKPDVMQQEGWDFTSPELREQGMPVAEFAQLRKAAPVWWNAQAPGKGGGFRDGGGRGR